MDLPGADSAATMTRNRSLPIDPLDPAKGSVNVTCGTAAYVCHGGTSYSTWSGKFNGSDGDSHFPYAGQSDDFAYANGAHGAAIEMFSPEQLPVKSAIAKQFGVFNKLYSSVPSASTPNHLCETAKPALRPWGLLHAAHRAQPPAAPPPPRGAAPAL
jgi:hypothetical protein